VDQPSRQHKFLHGKNSAAEILKIVLGGTVTSLNPRENGDMIDLNAVSTNDLSNLRFRGRNLGLYLPSSDADGLSLSTIDSNKTTDRSNPLHTFIDYFVYMTNNDMLDQFDIMKGLEFLSRTFESTFSSILGLNSVPMKIFLRKIFPSIVRSRNTSMAKAIIDSGTDMSNYRPPHPRVYSYALDNCMSIAVYNADQKMVELLCKEKFSVEIKSHGSKRLPWNLGNLDVLRTLLVSGADPDYFVVNEQPGFPLVDAARSGNLEAVDMLLTAGANVNSYALGHCWDALKAAIYSKNLDLAELLIDRGADVNATYRSPTRYDFFAHRTPHFTPFEIAVEVKSTPLVQLLITRGAHVGVCVPNHDEYDKDHSLRHCCALYSAVKNQNAALAGFLLLKGANVNCRGHWRRGDTPLQMAARRNYPEMVDFLLLHGADVNSAPANSHGRTAIQAAAENDSIEILRTLLGAYADVNAPAGHEDGLTVLQAAIKNRHPLMAGTLYALGADLNAPPGHFGGYTATQAAALSGDFDLLRNLIDWGAEINGPAAKKGGFTAMEAATLSNDISILELLVSNGVELNAISSGNGASRCLAMAASNEWLDGVRYLLEIGADLDGYWKCEDRSENFNALGWSIFRGNIPMMTLLLDSGVDVYSPVSTALDLNGQCALSIALDEMLEPETISLLLSRYKDLEMVCRQYNILVYAIDYKVQDSRIFKMLLNAISGLPKDVYDDQLQRAWELLPCEFEEECLDHQFIVLLLESGVDINSRNCYKETALHRTLDTEQTHISKYLIEKGAEINIPADGEIGTPLQEAIRKEQTEIVYLLLERGADINAAPAVICGITALQAASINGLMDLVIELLRRGASVAEPAAREYGRTAINGAAERGRQDMVQLLLNHYDGDEGLRIVCDEAATYAEKEGHVEVAEWLRNYSIF
jgi:ankyrin repeat protein